MAIPLCRVTGKIVNPSGIGEECTTILATLSDAVAQDPFLIRPTSAISDQGGNIHLDLWPNVLSSKPVTYSIKIQSPRQDPIYFHGINVPNVEEITLGELLGWVPPTPPYLGYWSGPAKWAGATFWR